MTYPNVDLQSLPFLETEVGTDHVERTIQLSYMQVMAALMAINGIYNGGTVAQFPERVSTAEQSAFTSAITTLRTELGSAVAAYKTIMAM